MNSPRRCSARRADGQPCRGRPLRDSDPPLCPAHAGRTGGSFYSRLYTVGEIADLVNLAADEGLDDEVAATRVAVRRVMEQLQQELSPAEYARLAGLVFRGTSTVANLLKLRRALKAGSEKSVEAILDVTLDDLGEEWGIDL